MGSKRFYEHAQNLLGGVKGEVGNFKLGGNMGLYCVIILYLLYYITLLHYYYVIVYILYSILYYYINILLYYIIILYSFIL